MAKNPRFLAVVGADAVDDDGDTYTHWLVFAYPTAAAAEKMVVDLMDDDHERHTGHVVKVVSTFGRRG